MLLAKVLLWKCLKNTLFRSMHKEQRCYNALQHFASDRSHYAAANSRETLRKLHWAYKTFKPFSQYGDYNVANPVTISLSICNSNVRRSNKDFSPFSVIWAFSGIGTCECCLCCYAFTIRRGLFYFPALSPSNVVTRVSWRAYLAWTLNTQSWLVLATQDVLDDDTGIPSEADRLFLWRQH